MQESIDYLGKYLKTMRMAPSGARYIAMMLLSVYARVKGYANVATDGNFQSKIPKSSSED